MSIQVLLGFSELEAKFEVVNFPAGEVGVRWVESRLERFASSASLENNFSRILWRWENHNEFFIVAQLRQMLQKYKTIDHKVSLTLPYIPYARQDRVGEDGMANGVKMFAKLINELQFDWVNVCDPHSDVASALIDNVFIESQADGFVEAMCHHTTVDQDCNDEWVLVAPDAGALKKTAKLAKLLNVPYISATKHRDEKTGEISRVELHLGDVRLHNKNVIVVDDICDGGGTFLPLAGELRNHTDEKVELYVTHGLFTKGVDNLKKVFDNVYCRNLMNATLTLDENSAVQKINA